MKIRTIVSALLLPLGAATAQLAQADIYIYDASSLPPRIVDVVPSREYAYISQPGYYGWDGTRYVWMGEQPIAGYQRWAYIPGASGVPEIGAAPYTFLRPGDTPGVG